MGLVAALVLACSDRPLYLPDGDRDLAIAPAPHDLAVPPVPRDFAAGPIDFGVPFGPPDLSSVDLTSASDLARSTVDLGGFCEGTAVAGTCLQSFFAAASACYQPAGACVVGPEVVLFHSYCYSNGAKATESDGLGLDDWIFRSSAGEVCFTWRRADSPNLFSGGGTSLYFDPATGGYTCDATFNRPTASIGPNCGGCSALCALLQLPTGCTDGDCR